MRFVARRHRGNDYGVSLTTTWPHISLGVSAHLGTRFAHLDLHLPVGVVNVGCLGATPFDDDARRCTLPRRRGEVA